MLSFSNAMALSRDRGEWRFLLGFLLVPHPLAYIFGGARV
jgi:hypothetical protein